MNLPAIVNDNPGLKALAEMFGGMLAQNNVDLTAKFGEFCNRFQQNNMSTAAALAQQAGVACKLGGACKGTCESCSGHSHALLGAQGDAWTDLVGFMQRKGCGVICRPMNPCFRWALQVMLTRVSLRRLYWMLEKEDDTAEIGTNAGAAADFVDITTTALVNNQKALLVMNASQMLPLMPVLSKATPSWAGDAKGNSVTVTLFQGAKNLGLLTLADVTANLMPLGQPKKLGQWFCTAINGTDGNCFLRPWPPFLGCTGGVIPDTEAVYMMIETDGNMGVTTLTGLLLEVIKAGTYDGNRYCKTCDIAVDEYGYPAQIPPSLL